MELWECNSISFHLLFIHFPNCCCRNTNTQPFRYVFYTWHCWWWWTTIEGSRVIYTIQFGHYIYTHVCATFPIEADCVGSSNGKSKKSFSLLNTELIGTTACGNLNCSHFLKWLIISLFLKCYVWARHGEYPTVRYTHRTHYLFVVHFTPWQAGAM